MAQKRILYIDPVGTDTDLEKSFQAYLNRYRSVSSEVVVKSLGKAPMDLSCRYYVALIAQDLLRMIKEAENDGFDAAIIGCFYDPFLDTARELCEKMIVVGPAEASMKLATTLGKTFSIIVPDTKCIPPLRENVYRLGFKDHLASFQPLDLKVAELLEDESLTEKKMRLAISNAIHQDLAEVIILGCTLQFGHFANLQKDFSVPVIDVCLAGLKYAEYLIEARDCCGWNTSKIGDYASPPKDQLANWQLEEKYGVKGLFR